MIIYETLPEYKKREEEQRPEFFEKNIKGRSDLDLLYEMYNKRRQAGDTQDFFSYVETKDPEGIFSSREKFMESGSGRHFEGDEDVNSMSDIRFAQRVYDYVDKYINLNREQTLNNKNRRQTKVLFKDFLQNFAPKPDKIINSEKYGTVAVKEYYSPAEIGLELNKYEGDLGTLPRGEISLNEARFAGSLAKDLKNQTIAYDKLLRPIVGQDPQISFGRYTNEFEFFNPALNEGKGGRQLINDPNFTLADVTGIGGDALVGAADMVGAGIGLIYGGPVGSVAGSGLASGVADAIRIGAGYNLYGINLDEKSDEEIDDLMTRAGVNTGLINAGITGTTYALPFIAKLGYRLAKGGKVELSDLAEDVDPAKLKQVEKLEREVNDRLDYYNVSRKVKFKLPQATNNPKQLADLEMYETDPNYGVAGKLGNFNKENAEALFLLNRKIQNSLQGTFDPFDPMATTKLNKQIQDIVNTRNKPRLKILSDTLNKSETNLFDEIIKLPDGQMKPQGQKIRTLVEELEEKMYTDFKEEYKLLGGLEQGRKIGTDLIQKYISGLTDKQKNNLLKVQPAIKDIIKLSKTGTLPKEVTLNQIRNTLSTVYDMERQAAKGIPEQLPGFATGLKKAIHEQFEKSLKPNDPWKLKYDEITNLYRKGKERFSGAIADLTYMKNGVPMIADENIFTSTFKKAGANTGQHQTTDLTYDILKERPDMLDGYRQAIEDFYRTKIKDKSAAQIRAIHKDFVDKDRGYGYILEKFYGREGMSNIMKNVDGLAKENIKIQAKNKRILEKFNKSFKGQLGSLDPDNIFDKTFNPKLPSQILRTVNIIKDKPELLGSYQRKVLENFKDRVSTKSFLGDQEFDPKKFVNVYGNQQERNALKIVFKNNPQVLKDLDVIGKSFEVFTRKAPGRPEKNKFQWLVDIIRVPFGVFTSEGRILSGSLKYLSAKYNKNMADVFMDPKKISQLREFIERRNSKTAIEKYDEDIIKYLFGFDYKAIGVDDEVSPRDIETIEKIKILRKGGQPSDVDITEIQPQQDAPTVDMFAMEQMPRPTAPAPVTPPPVQQPQPAGIAALPADRGQTYAGLFPNDPSGQMIAQRGRQNA